MRPPSFGRFKKRAAVREKRSQMTQTEEREMKKSIILMLIFSCLLFGITSSFAKPPKAGVANPPINRYSNVAVVAVSGGDYTDPVVAMENADSGDAWCREPGDTTTPCLLKIMPGDYDIWPDSLQMKEYVDIEGSGENTTKIISALSASSFPPDVATLRGADNAELRFVTVENTGTAIPASYTAAILNSVASPSLLHVTATASTAAVSARSYGVYNDHSSPTITNVTANGSGGDNCLNYGMYNYYSSPTMTNVTANGSVGSGSWGVYSFYSSFLMTNVMATGSGAKSNYGIRNSSYSFITMTNVTATASGGSSANAGFYNSTMSSTIMTNVTVTASGDPSHGLWSDSGSVEINHSVIKGETQTVVSSSTSTMRIGNSKLEGGPVYAGDPDKLKCAGVYDEDYIFYASSCP
jgi:hypothetical protein